MSFRYIYQFIYNEGVGRHSPYIDRFVNPFGFTGYQRENVGGMLYAQARYYDPRNGRFNAEDGARDGLNWYEYARSNPLRFVDKDGLSALDALKESHPALWNQIHTGTHDGSPNIAFEPVPVPPRPPRPQRSLSTGRSGLRDVTDEINLALIPTIQEARSMPVVPFVHSSLFVLTEQRYGRIYWFYNEVDHGASWDIKLERSWRNTIGTDFPGADRQVSFRGSSMTPEQLGNFLYGYIGAALGLTLLELAAGSVYAALNSGQLQNSSQLLNELNDWLFITRGFNSFSHYRYKFSRGQDCG